jgi:hypothetical protein
MRGYSDWQSDEYTNQTRRQNQGQVCEHCTAEWGHYAVCPLLNRSTAEAKSNAEGRSAAMFKANVDAGFYRRERVRAEVAKTPDVIELERMFALEDNR